MKKYGPGETWRDADKSVRIVLMSNGSITSQPTYHRGFNIFWSGTALSLVRNSKTTTKATLLIEKTIDEDERIRYEFKNMHGEIVLSREISDDGSWNDTHFIYDAFGRLAAILPPKLTAQLESSTQTYLHSHTCTDTTAEEIVLRNFFQEEDGHTSSMTRETVRCSARMLSNALKDSGHSDLRIYSAESVSWVPQ